MKRLTILSLLILIVAVIYFIVVDFSTKHKNIKTPYVYDLESKKQIDSSLIAYRQVDSIVPGMEELKALFIDKSDRLYVTAKNQVTLYDNKGVKISNFSTVGTVRSMDSDKSSLFFAIDDHIEIWNHRGKMVKRWKPTNQDAVLTSVLLKDRDVFVADAGNRIVQRFNRSGRLINTIGARNKDKGIKGFIVPSAYFDLAIGRNDELWVVNPGRQSLEAYTPEGEQITSWRRRSMQVSGFCGCCNPSYIAMLSNGSFVTSEKSIERVKIHHPTGEFKSVVVGPNMFKSGTKGLDIAVDSHDRIYVLDPVKSIIRIFEEK